MLFAFDYTFLVVWIEIKMFLMSVPVFIKHYSTVHRNTDINIWFHEYEIMHFVVKNNPYFEKKNCYTVC